MAQGFSGGDLIPGLTDEVSELCLLRLPFPCAALLRSVSSAWNRTLSNPSFFTTKSRLSLTKPYLLVLSEDQFGHIIPWRCLDPISKNWCPLPPMPIPDVDMWELASMASSVAKEKGEMYVFIGDSKYCAMVYSVATNSWRIGNHSKKPEGSFFTSAAINGKVFAFSRDVGWMISADCSVRVQCYDPVLDSLVNMAETTCGIASHDAVVIGKKIYVIEGWKWRSRNHVQPKGRVYDCELNTWKDMPVGMRNGWTGPPITLGPNLFVFERRDDDRAKVYDNETDSWMQVKGSGIPKVESAPYAYPSYTVTADEETGKIYVVGRGLNVAIATLIEVESKKWEIEWDVIEGPDAFLDFNPCDSQILYA